MAHSAGSGDALARGAIRVTYTVRDEKTISQKKWDDMFKDFDPEEFKKNGMPKMKGTKPASSLG